jgi:hypothetical protein
MIFASHIKRMREIQAIRPSRRMARRNQAHDGGTRDEMRVVRVEQHPRQFPDEAGDRVMRVAAKVAGGAEGRRFARSVLVENDDGKPVLAQRQRTADADDPGADNDDPLLGPSGAAHRLTQPGYQPTA